MTWRARRVGPKPLVCGPNRSEFRRVHPIAHLSRSNEKVNQFLDLQNSKGRFLTGSRSKRDAVNGDSTAIPTDAARRFRVAQQILEDKSSLTPASEALGILALTETTN
jgi:hypothetical protein